MGPTYFWFQWHALRELAGSFGLPAADADRALRAMLDGAVRTFFDEGLTPEEVLDLVPVKPLAEREGRSSRPTGRCCPPCTRSSRARSAIGRTASFRLTPASGTGASAKSHEPRVTLE